MIVLFKMPPEHRAEALSRVPKYTKAVMYRTKKVPVIDELRSCVSSSAAGCEFNANAKKRKFSDQYTWPLWKVLE